MKLVQETRWVDEVPIFVRVLIRAGHGVSATFVRVEPRYLTSEALYFVMIDTPDQGGGEMLSAPYAECVVGWDCKPITYENALAQIPEQNRPR